MMKSDSCNFEIDDFGAACLNPKRLGSAEIRSIHNGFHRSDYAVPCVEICVDRIVLYVSLLDFKIMDIGFLANEEEEKSINDSLDIIKRNSDLFLKHYYDTKDEFDDMDLFKALAERGDYKL